MGYLTEKGNILKGLPQLGDTNDFHNFFLQSVLLKSMELFVHRRPSPQFVVHLLIASLDQIIMN